jgi:WD40 repeat protein
VVGVGGDKYVKVWQTWSYRQNFKYPKNGEVHVRHAAFRPIPEADNRSYIVASAWDDGSVRLWDFANDKTGEAVRTLEQKHEGKVSRVNWSMNGRWLASSGQDGKILIWDCKNWKDPRCVLQLLSNAGEVRGLRFSSDNHWVAHATENNGALLWNVAKVTAPREFKVSFFYAGNAPASAKESLAAAVDNAGFKSVGAQEVTVRLPDMLEIRYFRYPEDQAKAREVLNIVQKLFPRTKARISYVKDTTPNQTADFEIWFSKETPQQAAPY